MRPKPLVLAILDGWGVAPPGRGNAITSAKTPNFNSFVRGYPAMTLQASGEAVGLPWGEPGNSEVGHLALGSGLVVYQEFPRISKAIRDESFFTNPVFQEAVAHVRAHVSHLHLLGLTSSGGVHSHLDHLEALLELARREGINEVYLHVILDGRDVPYNSGADFIGKVESKMAELGIGKIATVVGRFYAMDRDHRWERISAAYRAIVNGQGERYTDDAVVAVRRYYDEGVFDEELPPVVVGTTSRPTAVVGSGDSIVFFNFRPDRARELTAALTVPDFDKFERGPLPRDLYVATMTQYDEDLPAHVAFPKLNVALPVAKVVSDAGLTQLHVAETEKYAHVTYFFNGGFEKPFPREEHVLVPSPHVISYADTPAMAASAITETVVAAILGERYDFIVVNFANADMVGHTGNEPATVAAVESIDQCLGLISDAILAKNGLLLITADHGNAEVVLNPQTGEIDKEHNQSPVPFIAVANALHGKTAGFSDAPGEDLSLVAPAGVLADVAPTVLKLLELPIPEEMTGRPLL